MPACDVGAAAVVDLSRSMRQRLSLPSGGGAGPSGAQELCKLFMLGKPHSADCQASAQTCKQPSERRLTRAPFPAAAESRGAGGASAMQAVRHRGTLRARRRLLVPAPGAGKRF